LDRNTEKPTAYVETPEKYSTFRGCTAPAQRWFAEKFGKYVENFRENAETSTTKAEKIAENAENCGTAALDCTPAQVNCGANAENCRNVSTSAAASFPPQAAGIARCRGAQGCRHSGLLGALLTFAPRLWYPIYAARTSRWGLSPLEDQQLAGLIMWIPAGVLFIVLGLGLFAAWLGEAPRLLSPMSPTRSPAR